MKLIFPAVSVGTLTFERPGGKVTEPAEGVVEFDESVLPLLTLSENGGAVLATLPDNCLSGVFAPFEDALLAELPRFPDLQRLVFTGSGATDAAFEAASQLVHLTQFGIAGDDLTARGFAHVSALTEMEMFIVSSEHDLSEAAGALEPLQSLIRLFILSPTLALEAVPPLAKLEHLRGFGDVATIDLEVLTRHPALTDLGIRDAEGEQPGVLETIRLRHALPDVTINGIWHAPAMLKVLERKAAQGS